MAVIVDTSRFDAKVKSLSDRAKSSLLRKIVTRLQGFAADRMKLRAPVDTGLLRGSITKSGAGQTKQVFPNPTVQYAKWVERTWDRKRYHGAPRGPGGSSGIRSGKGYIADSRKDAMKEASKIAKEETDKAIKEAGFT